MATVSWCYCKEKAIGHLSDWSSSKIHVNPKYQSVILYKIIDSQQMSDKVRQIEIDEHLFQQFVSSQEKHIEGRSCKDEVEIVVV